MNRRQFLAGAAACAIVGVAAPVSVDFTVTLRPSVMPPVSIADLNRFYEVLIQRWLDQEMQRVYFGAQGCDDMGLLPCSHASASAVSLLAFENVKVSTL